MWRHCAQSALAILATYGWTATQAASVYIAPSDSAVSVLDGTTVLHLFMDFSDEITLGGGIDLDIAGPVSLAAFTPSAYFATLDPAFTGFSTAPDVADNDLAIWFGDFSGLSGVNELGTLALNLLGEGTATLDIGINSLYGPFYSAETFDLQDVLLSGATINVTPVPLPGALWLLMSGLGAIGAFARNRRMF